MLRFASALLLLSAPHHATLGPGSGHQVRRSHRWGDLSDISNLAGVGDDRWGGTAGLFGGVNAGPTALTLEANSIQKGGGDTKLSYIEFPLTIGAILAPEGKTYRARIYSGVSFGFKVDCNCENAKGSEWGWPLGLQIAKVTDTGKFFGFDVKYTWPLSDAFEFRGRAQPGVELPADVRQSSRPVVATAGGLDSARSRIHMASIPVVLIGLAGWTVSLAAQWPPQVSAGTRVQVRLSAAPGRAAGTVAARPGRRPG